jgi:hypothetical protein
MEKINFIMEIENLNKKYKNLNLKYIEIKKSYNYYKGVEINFKKLDKDYNEKVKFYFSLEKLTYNDLLKQIIKEIENIKIIYIKFNKKDLI